jgi:hypothetical protein
MRHCAWMTGHFPVSGKANAKSSGIVSDDILISIPSYSDISPGGRRMQSFSAA